MLKDEKLFKLLSCLADMPWQTEITDQQIIDIAKSVYTSFVAEKTRSCRAIHLFGQSGSGKTTQLLPSAFELCKDRNINPVHISVRSCAPFHPQYEELVKTSNHGEIREKTNGFALRCVSAILAMAISEGYDIICEITLLSKKYEDFFAKLLEQKNYDVLFLGTAVNQDVSNLLIEKRKNEKAEKNRVVYKSSSDYFFEHLADSLKHLSRLHPNFNVVVWNIAGKIVYDGKLGGCYNIFKSELKKMPSKFEDTSLLLFEKIKYLKFSRFLLEDKSLDDIV